MSDWLFTIFGWLLLLGGIFVAWRFGWRDSGRGSRRCPKCWYDMAATAGRKCPECGHESKNEKSLFRASRRWRWVAAGLAIVVASWVVFRWPDYQKLGPYSGPVVFLPRTVLVVGWPAIVLWEEASNNKPKAWWAKSDSRTFFNLEEPLRSRDIWGWQEWLKLKVSALVIARVDSWSIRLQASEFITQSPSPPEWAIDAFMTRYAERTTSPWSHLPYDRRGKLRSIDPKWIEPVAATITAQPELLRFDPTVLNWLGISGRNMSDIGEAVLGAKLPTEPFSQALTVLCVSKLDETCINHLITGAVARKKKNGVSIARLLALLGPEAARYPGALGTVMLHSDPFARIHACLAIARIGIPDSALLQLLQIGSDDGNQAVCLAAKLAEVSLFGDEQRLRVLAKESAAVIREERVRDQRFWIVTTLFEFANAGILPSDVCDEILMSAADGDANDNWYDSLRSMQLLIERQSGPNPQVVEFAARKIDDGGQIGWFAWKAYVRKGRAPAVIVEAARRAASKLQDQRKAQILSEAGSIAIE